MRTQHVFPALLLLGAGTASSQAVRATALTLDSVAVPGVIVTLLDSKGVAVAHALSDANGRFEMRAPAAGRYRIEARRIAFRPTMDIPIDLQDGKILLHLLALTGSPVELNTVRTVATPTCEANPDSTSAAFTFWEEARKALQASRLSRLTRDYRVDVTRFIRRQSQISPIRDSATVSGLTIHPFASLSPGDLAEHGYMTRDGMNMIFHAPDEDVLLSEPFAATHCLRILPDSGSLNAVRLGFSPLPGREKPEISGVLSIDRETSELRRLDFSFVNIPSSVSEGRRGGEMVFRRLPEGGWLIDEWAIWVPVVDTRVEPNPTPPTASPIRGVAPRIAPPRITTTRGVQVTGGRVIRVTRGDSTIWTRAP